MIETASAARGEHQRRAGCAGWAWPSRPNGERVYVGGGSRAAVFEFTFADGTLTAGRTFAVVPPGQRTRAGFHRRRGLLARWPAALCRRAVSRFGGGDQSAIRHGDRAHQDRPPALPHPVPPRWQVVLRHPLGGWLGGPVRRRRRQPAWRGAHRRASHRHGLARRRPAKTAWRASRTWAARLFVAAANTNNVYAVAVSDGEGAARGGEHQHLHDARGSRWA